MLKVYIYIVNIYICRHIEIFKRKELLFFLCLWNCGVQTVLR